MEAGYVKVCLYAAKLRDRQAVVDNVYQHAQDGDEDGETDPLDLARGPERGLVKYGATTISNDIQFQEVVILPHPMNTRSSYKLAKRTLHLLFAVTSKELEYEDELSS